MLVVRCGGNRDFKYEPFNLLRLPRLFDRSIRCARCREANIAFVKYAATVVAGYVSGIASVASFRCSSSRFRCWRGALLSVFRIYARFLIFLPIPLVRQWFTEIRASERGKRDLRCRNSAIVETASRVPQLWTINCESLRLGDARIFLPGCSKNLV